jgi:MraZ protein
VFRGISAVNIDAKGRIAMPARYRERLVAESAPQLVLTIDTEEACLLLYPISEWEVIEQKLQALPTFNKAARRIQRLLIGHATELEIDNSNRILLPPLLREYANLDKRIMLVGQGKKFELWDEQQWRMGRETWLDKETSGPEELPPEMQSLAL